MTYRKAGKIVKIPPVGPVMPSVAVDVRSREISDMTGRRMTHR